MTDQILIKKLSHKTDKSRKEIEKILDSIDLKLINWIFKSDGMKKRQLLPLLITDFAVSKYLMVNILKNLKKNENENN